MSNARDLRNVLGLAQLLGRHEPPPEQPTRTLAAALAGGGASGPLAIMETAAAVLTVGAPYYLLGGSWTALDEYVSPPVRVGLVLSTDGTSSSQLLIFGTFPRTGTPGALLYAVTSGEGYISESEPAPNAHIVGWQIDATTALWNPVASSGAGFPLVSPDTNWTVNAIATNADGAKVTLSGTDGSSITLQDGPGGLVVTLLDSSGSGWQVTPTGFNLMVGSAVDGHGTFAKLSVHACIDGTDTVIDVLGRVPS